MIFMEGVEPPLVGFFHTLSVQLLIFFIKLTLACFLLYAICFRFFLVHNKYFPPITAASAG